MEYTYENQFLKELFEYFGCKDAEIKEVQIEDDELPLMSFVAGATIEGQSIDSPEWIPFFGADTPHFCIVSKGIGYVRIDLCMELSFVKEYLVGLYLKKEFLNTLAVYFNNGAVVNPQPVEFGAILHFSDFEWFVENFGSIENYEVKNRAITGHSSNLVFPESEALLIDEFHFNNVIDIRMVSDDHETFADNYRFALSIEDLEEYVQVLTPSAKKDGYSFKFIVNTHEVNSVDAVVAEFEHSQSYWKEVYKEGLTE